MTHGGAGRPGTREGTGRSPGICCPGIKIYITTLFGTGFDGNKKINGCMCVRNVSHLSWTITLSKKIVRCSRQKTKPCRRGPKTSPPPPFPTARGWALRPLRAVLWAGWPGQSHAERQWGWGRGGSARGARSRCEGAVRVIPNSPGGGVNPRLPKVKKLLTGGRRLACPSPLSSVEPWSPVNGDGGRGKDIAAVKKKTARGPAFNPIIPIPHR